MPSIAQPMIQANESRIHEWKVFYEPSHSPVMKALSLIEWANAHADPAVCASLRLKISTLLIVQVPFKNTRII